MKKRLFSLLMALSMLLSLVPVAANAADVWVTGNCGISGDNVTYTIYEDGLAVISGQGKMYNYGGNSPLYSEDSVFTRNPNWVSSVVIEPGVTNVGEKAFFRCYGLTGLTLPEGLESIEYNAFSGCYRLENLTIPHGTEIIRAGAFAYCSGLKNVQFSETLETVEDNAFSECENLTSVSIPEGLKSLGLSAFYFCTSLPSVSLPSTLQSVGKDAFNRCDSMTEIVVDPRNPNYSSAKGVLFDKDQTTLIRFPGGKGGAYTIPSGVTTLEENAFCFCNNLTRVTMPDGTLTVGKSAFSDCENLESVKIPDSVQELGESAFSYCTSLLSLKLPSGLTRLESCLLCGDYALTDVTIPEGVQSIGDGVFSFCKNLKNVEIPDGVVAIGERAFSSCQSLTSLVLPEGLWTISNDLFDGCKSLNSLKIPGKVSSIGEYAFNNCSSMSYMILPVSVVSIGTGAFVGCYGLKDVYYGGSEEQWKSIQIGRDNDNLKKATIHFNSTGPSVQEEQTPYSGTPAAAVSDITFRYNVSESSAQGKWSLPYADDYLSGSARTFRPYLAKISLGLAMASTNQKFEGANVGYTYIQEMLENMGFDRAAMRFSPDYADTQSGEDQCKYSFAVKKLAGSEDYVVTVVIRSNGYGGEWVSNAHVNDGVNPDFSAGFNGAAEGVYAALTQYLSDLPIDQNHLKLWVTGFSRGGAIANLVGAKLTERSGISADRIFVYGFAVPRNVQSGVAVPYGNIFNIINPCDMVPRVPLQAWGFERYGVNKFLPCASKNGRGYRAVRASMENYFDHLMQCSQLASTKYALVSAQERVLDLLLAYITDIIPTKESYRNDGYQNTVMQACRAWQIDGEEISLEYVMREIFGLSRECTAGLLGVFEDWDQDSIGNRAVKIIAAESLLNDWADANGSAQAQKIRNMILDLLGHVALYVSMDLNPLTVNFSMSKSKQYVELVTMIADLVKCGKDGRAFGSALLMQHWPETYLSWMMAGDENTVYTEGTYTTLSVKCPVDITVYDETDTVVARIVNDVIDESIDGLYCETDSFGEKTIVMPDDGTYRTVITAREAGVLDIVEQKFSADDEVLDTNCYIQLSMEAQQAFDVSVSDTCTVTTEGTVLTPDEVLDEVNRTVEIRADAQEGGSVTGAKAYPLGETAALMATPDAHHSFAGWYEGDTLLSTETVLHFSAVADRTVTVRFAVSHVYENGVCTICGEPDPDYDPNPGDDPDPGQPNNPFEDVIKGKYYYNAVLWAVNHDPQITKGTDATHFKPNAPCTRGEVVTFLWRAMGCPEPTKTDCPFTDVGAKKFYYKAVLWAVENGITKGTSGTTFGPNEPCTRGHVVTFLYRAKKAQPVTAENVFTDLNPKGFYYKAVLWAVANDVTQGATKTTFEPGKTCTRGQIVTFLQRADKV